MKKKCRRSKRRKIDQDNNNLLKGRQDVGRLKKSWNLELKRDLVPNL